MILCIDSGNTRLKWSLRLLGDATWLAQGSLWQKEFSLNPNQLWQSLVPLLPAQGLSEIWVSHVASSAVKSALVQLFEQDLQLPMHWVLSQAHAVGVSNGYQFPEKLGVDRWCALLGARATTASACVVVMAGTATTIDTLNAHGHFQGGMILPGIHLMKQALAKDTAALPWADGQHHPWPTTTQDAIVTGCMEAQAGAIERAYARIAQAPGACVLLSGGSAEVLRTLLSCPVKTVDNLVMDGLWCLVKADR